MKRSYLAFYIVEHWRLFLEIYGKYYIVEHSTFVLWNISIVGFGIVRNLRFGFSHIAKCPLYFSNWTLFPWRIGLIECSKSSCMSCLFLQNYHNLPKYIIQKVKTVNISHIFAKQTLHMFLHALGMWHKTLLLDI